MWYKIAGIDVHKKVLMVVVIDATTPEEKPERRRFATMPSDLQRLLIWLREQGVEEAVMESTAQYWRSVWLELEPHMRLHLAQAFSNRAPRGRKHDFKDAERLVRRLIALRSCESARETSEVCHAERARSGVWDSMTGEAHSIDTVVRWLSRFGDMNHMQREMSPRLGVFDGNRPPHTKTTQDVRQRNRSHPLGPKNTLGKMAQGSKER